MTNSITSNAAAVAALENLRRINDLLEITQNRIATGLRVSSAKDDPAVFALAQKQRADLASIESVQLGLGVGVSTVDVALAAGESISDILVEMSAIASEATDPSLSAENRALLQDQYADLADQITLLVDTAEIGGRNLIESGAADLTVLASTDGAHTITVAAQDLSVGGGIIDISADGSALSTDVGAVAELAVIETAMDELSTALGALGSGSSALGRQDDLLFSLSGTLELSIANLVEADVAAESTKLEALQVQQQLALQALSIANAAPNAILALFA